MIGIDTNILVRAIVADDAGQTQAARAALNTLTAAQPGHITHVVLAELWWVLTHAYNYSPAHALVAVETLRRTEHIVIQDVADVDAALDLVRQHGADFADALIMAVNRRAGCEGVLTFDRRAVKRAGMTHLT